MATLHFNGEELLGAHSCVVVRDGAALHTLQGKGLRPLLQLHANHADDLQGASVADTVVGRAAAALLIVNGVAVVYGKLMSRGAYDWLTAHGITATYGQLVENIRNRDNTGVCVMELLVADCIEAGEAVKKILVKVKGTQ
ncbi:MAG: DUF1893 domain-containing protein [Oscillospiraceae bacterium]|nr:DUF1893 domain-containing protein [Oscillospiraceae bacterium]